MALDRPIFNPYFGLHRRLSQEPEPLQLALRKNLIWAYSWAIPNDEAIEALVEISPIVELGAGSGYWAWLIQQAGGQVRAIDSNPTSPPHWTAVERGDASDLGRENCLLLCWPPLDEPMAVEALRAFRGRHVAYIGEWRGRTADAAFHDELERSWKREREIEIPTWPGFRDRLYLFSSK